MTQDSTRFLRRTLLADGVTSGLSGLALVSFPGTIASLIGVASAWLVALVGVSLMAFAAGLLTNARRPVPDRGEARTAVVLNIAWLVGSVGVVLAGWLTPAGNWALGLVGLVVLAFTELEAVGLTKMAVAGVSAGRPVAAMSQARP